MTAHWTALSAERLTAELARQATSYTCVPIEYRGYKIHLEDERQDGEPGCGVECLGEWIRGNDWGELKARIDARLAENPMEGRA